MPRYIDADALFSRLEEMFNRAEANARYTGARGNSVTWNDAVYAIKSQPTADVRENKNGKWILVQEADETGNALYECSVCHKGEVHVPIIEVSYCWNCGADMRGGQDA